MPIFRPILVGIDYGGLFGTDKGPAREKTAHAQFVSQRLGAPIKAPARSHPGPHAAASGFLPAMLRGRQSGFEIFHDDARELMETYADVPCIKSFPAWNHVISFRWGSRAHEGVSVFMAATAYAKATGGVVF